jgi:cytochrome c-type protein NapB
MENSNQKLGKLFIVFAGLCILLLPAIVLWALSYAPLEIEAAEVQKTPAKIDENGAASFASYSELTRDYLVGASNQRTLAEFYSRRQYPGSPPWIPHKVTDETQEQITCLTCHERGGWTEELKRHTPLTPHPENTSCSQCHLKMETESLFVDINWQSVMPPRLGRSHLPGGPPPIPHELQMRENCIACHVGPGAVATIRVDHASRGYCRQCHVPDSYTGLFQR